MDFQTTPVIDRQPMPGSKAKPIDYQRTPSLANLTLDGLKLADLQLQLLQIDVVEFWHRSQLALMLLTIGAVLFVSAMPVALLGLAGWVGQYTSLTRDGAMVVVGGVVIVIASGLLAWACRRIGRAIKPLGRSHEELRANLAWMRHLLHNHDSES